MSKKKGLGSNIEKSLEVMEDLLKALSVFTKMPLKKGLAANSVEDKDVSKIINESLVDASTLKNKVEDLQAAVRAIKPEKGNSRFANRVVSRFLDQVTN